MSECINIVTPVYNAQKTLRECIKSVLNQTAENWNLFLVDDGSTDGSGTICDEYANKDPRITVLHQTNRGCYEARETGIQRAIETQGGYIAFLDADDRLPENVIEIYTNYIKKYNADIICGRLKRVWKKIPINDRFIPECFQGKSPRVYKSEEFLSELSLSYFGVSNYPVSLCAKCFKTSLASEVKKMGISKNVTHFFGEDLIRTLPMSLNAKNILITKKR